MYSIFSYTIIIAASFLIQSINTLTEPNSKCGDDGLCLNFTEYLMIVQIRLDNDQSLKRLEVKYTKIKSTDLLDGEKLDNEQDLENFRMKSK